MSTISDTSSAAYAERLRYEAAEAERSRAQENHQEEINDLKEEFAAEKKKTSSEYNSKISQERKEAQEEVRRLKDELYNKEGKKFSNDSRDLSEQKARVQQTQKDLEQDFEDRTAELEQTMHSRMSEAEERKNQALEKAMREQTKSHREEVRHLNDTIRQANVDPRDLEHEKAVARAETIGALEGDNRVEKRNIVGAYEATVAKMKENDEAQKFEHQERLSDVKYAGEAKANEMLRQQRKAFLERDQQRVTELKQAEGEFSRGLRREQQMSQRGAETLRTNNELQTRAALDQQAETYNHQSSLQKGNYEYELGQKTQELNKLKSTDDELLASPALVNRIHRTEESRHAKELSAEHLHHKNQQEGLKARDAQERSELLSNYQKGLTTAQKENARKLDQTKSQLLSTYEDLKTSKELEVEQLKAGQSAFAERNHLKHAHELNLLQRRNMEAMEAQRESLSDGGRRQVEDVEFQNKVLNREWSARMSEMQREHNGKLADISMGHEAFVNELRLDFDTRLKEQERKSNKTLEDRVKGYEHQIKQQELAFKDRERFLTEHYEEEIDKMKRTNARLIQKKS